MESTTDFEAWWELNEPDTPEEIRGLYRSVDGREDHGYEVSTKGEKTFVKGAFSTLVLASEAARQAFLTFIDKAKGDDEMDVETWADYRHAIEKDD